MTSTYEVVRTTIDAHGIDFSDSASAPYVRVATEGEHQWFEFQCDCGEWVPDKGEHMDHVANKILDAIYDLSPAVSLIAAERARHASDEGYDASHDEWHSHELAVAGACYAMPHNGRLVDFADGPGYIPPRVWPWAGRAWKPTPDNRVKELTKSGALIAAALDEELRLRRG